MRKIGVCLIILSFTLNYSFAQKMEIKPLARSRVIVLTDIGNEPDDQQSLVRFLAYANEYDTEALIATTSKHLKNKINKDKITNAIKAYGKVRDNLIKHAQGFPEEDFLHSITKAHLPLLGMAGVGEGKDSEGSEFIIEVVDKDDERPVWISVWGGANCLAQALWKVRESRNEEQLRKFVQKLRVYTISDQDDAGSWIRKNFPDLFYIVSPGEIYNQATWSGISGDRFYKNGPFYKFDLVDNPWLQDNIINNHGPLGAYYPLTEYIMEGDTPSFLGLIENGLVWAVNPTFGGWGGRYVFKKTGDGNIWTNDSDEVLIENEKLVASDQATIWRWREAYQHDFAARMDWCVSANFKEANHNPVVVINGDKSKGIIYIKNKSGKVINLSAKGSYDPDNDILTYKWFVYNEAGRLKQNVVLNNNSGEKISFTMPKLGQDEHLHIICEVKDNGNPSLYSYRRIILSY
jgi:hypothetical protein